MENLKRRLKSLTEPLKRSWDRLPATVRKPLVFIIGTTIVVIGVLLIPLPGPGWVIVFAGFALLATEFEPAEKIRDWLIRIFKKGAEYLRLAWASISGRSHYETSQNNRVQAKNKAKSKH